MSKKHRREYFKEVKEHSQVKLTAVRRYLRPWSTMVGSQRHVDRLWVVDGFAGAGVYESGEFGSAGIALEEARWIKRNQPKFEMACLLIEKYSKNYRTLRRLHAGYREVQGNVVHGSFWESTSVVVDWVGTEPCFLFVDPFGLGDLDFEVLVGLCEQLPHLDLMVNLASPAARRLEAGNAALVSKAVGGDGWTVDTISEVFQARLRARTNMLTASLPVTAELGDLKYEVILGARHPRALELWNDEISSAERGILDGADESSRLGIIKEARQTLLDELKGRRRIQRDRYISEVMVTRCGESHSRTYRSAVESLIADGLWDREPGPVGTSWISV